MDMNMPGMNGIDAAKIIRKLSQKVYIVLLTSNRLEQIDTENITEYIEKPIKKNILYNILNKINSNYCNLTL